MWTKKAFWFSFVVVWGSFLLGSTKKHEGKPTTELKHHQTKSVVHEAREASPQTLLKTAPLGFGLGIKSQVPTTKDNGKKDDADSQEEDGNIKTESETTTTKNGPFRTVTTVTKKIKMGKNNTQKLVGQSITKVTTNLPGLKKPGKFKAGKSVGMNGLFNPFGIDDPKKPSKVKEGKSKETGLMNVLFNPFGIPELKEPSQVKNGRSKGTGLMLDLFNPFGYRLFGDELELPQCSSKKHCNKPGMYCDKMDNQCRKKVKLDGRCDQAGQCDSDENKHVACLWGRCALVTKSAGCAGLFCKKDKDCKSEELHCAAQMDISEVSNVCIYKLSEGQTCGRRNLFNFFARGGENNDVPCKKGLTCQQLGYTGRKICRRPEILNDDDKNEEDRK